MPARPSRRTARLLAAGGLTVVVTAGVGIATATTADAGGDNRPVIAAGPLADLNTAVAQPFDHAYGKATLYRIGGSSLVLFEVADVDRAAAKQTFGVHLHVGPCVTNEPKTAGDHYNAEVVAKKIPYAEATKSKRTEVWLDVTIDGRGRGRSWTFVPFVPEAGTRSIVVHTMPTDPASGMAGDRQACLPLTWAPQTAAAPK